jgi:hypothetical protein
MLDALMVGGGDKAYSSVVQPETYSEYEAQHGCSGCLDWNFTLRMRWQWEWEYHITTT